MSRPKKLTLDFFVYSAHTSSDRRIQKLKRRHGNDGMATYIYLLEDLCLSDGIIMPIESEEDADVLADRYCLRDVAHFYKILESMAELDLIDRQLWESERTIFSHDLWDSYQGRLEERQKAAQRKKRSRESKALAERISEVESRSPIKQEDALSRVTTCDNEVVTRPSQTEIRDQITEDKDQKTESHTELAIDSAIVFPGIEIKSAAERCNDSFKPKKEKTLVPWRINSKPINCYDPAFLDYLCKVVFAKWTFNQDASPTRSDAIGWISKRESNPSKVAELHARYDDFLEWQSSGSPSPGKGLEPSAEQMARFERLAARHGQTLNKAG